MDTSRLAALRENWAAALGWLVFIGLFVALLADYYIFNPFIFGGAYYAIYALSRIAKPGEKDNPELLGQRLICISIIALLFLWGAFRNEVDKREFIRQFERTCYSRQSSGGEVKDRLCEEIQSHIDNSLQREYDFDAE